MGTPAEDMDSCVVALAGGVGEAPLRAETDAPDDILRKWGVCARSVFVVSTTVESDGSGILVLAWVGVVAMTAVLVLSVRGRGVGRERGVLIRRFFPALRGRRELEGRELGLATGSSCTGSTGALAACRSSDSLSFISGMMDAGPSFARTLSSCESRQGNGVNMLKIQDCSPFVGSGGPSRQSYPPSRQC